MSRVCVLMVGLAAVVLMCTMAAAEPTVIRLEDVPVREVTIFKDGHAFVTHEGELEIKDGAVVLDYLPEPVLGAFWAYARGRRVTLHSVVAGTEEVEELRTATTLAELLRANAGKTVTLSVRSGDEIVEVRGALVGVPEREVEREVTTPARQEYDYRRGRYIQIPPVTREATVTERGDIVLLNTGDGLHTFPLASVVSAVFPIDAGREITETIEKRRLRLNISGGRGKSTVGMTYLQKGLRWIPEYKVTLEDEGKASIKLQGTIVNEMVDLEDVTVYLVVGVPNFAFKDQLSPLALKDAAAELSRYFESNGRTGWAFSNAIMGQTASLREEYYAGPQPGPSATEAVGAHEDLFLYKVEHLSLKKGERMIVPVTEFPVSYADVYVWQVPFSPPPELLQHLNNQDREQWLAMSSGRRVHHKLRIKNESEVPLTTGPALLIKDDRVLAQSLIRYTSIGNEVDVDVTVATDIHTKKWEKQIDRQDNAKRISGHDYTRLEMRGFLQLTNYKDEAVTVEITRAVLGTATEADTEGEITQLNSFEDLSYLPEGGAARRGWTWGWWSRWPWWWHSLNDVGQIKWEVTLEPGEKKQLQYEWYYYTY